MLALGCIESAWAKDAEMALRVPDRAINAKKKKKSVKAGGPGSGRRPEDGNNMREWGKARRTMENLANMHKPHDGMCNLGDPVCRAYIDMKEENPGFMPKGHR